MPEPATNLPLFIEGAQHPGRYDDRAHAALAKNELDCISAPEKAFVWFEQSAHSPPFEEPVTINTWITAHIRPIAVDQQGHTTYVHR